MTGILLILIALPLILDSDKPAKVDPNQEYEREFWKEWNNLIKAPGTSANAPPHAHKDQPTQ